MKKQIILFKDTNIEQKNKINLAGGLDIIIEEEPYPKATLYRQGIIIKVADLSDRVAKRLFVVEAIELGAIKRRLAEALDISRQTIDNYLDIKKHFGLEGLIQGYTPSDSKSRRKQRKTHSDKRPIGNKTRQVEQIRQKSRDEREAKQQQLDFNFGYNENARKVPVDEQPFSEEHDWEETRYAGVFSYLIPLVSKWRWLQLIISYFGDKYRIFMVFILMAASNIRSIEQLKHIRVREAGIMLGIKRLVSKPKIWEWFYNAADMRISSLLKKDYFLYQIRNGIVGFWLWFTDGHLLPYTGKKKVHYSYNTQRRMPEPGQTNLVTCDKSGRIVDFEIQEGKGDLKERIVELSEKWKNELPGGVGAVFDREGNGAAFFSKLVRRGITFATWEKNVDSKKLSALDDSLFDKDLKFNGKSYSFFEEAKVFTYEPEKDSDDSKHEFELRRIYIWNKSSNRRTCGLAWSGKKVLSTQECVKAILSRWGASENTFKHMKERHPLHYHPGFKMSESEKQEIANPSVKEKERLISRAKKQLSKIYKKLAKARKILNKDGSVRQNSAREKLKKTVEEQDAKILELTNEKKELPERVDVSTLENYKSFKKIDNEGKNLFDFVTCSVWNVRKYMVDALRPFYDSEYDLVDLFYAITECRGWIKSTKNEVICRLEPLQQPKRRSAQEQLCRKLTSLGVQTPTGKCMVIEVGESPL